MNTAYLKSFAPEARRLLIEAVRARAALVGVGPQATEHKSERVGDLYRINGLLYEREVWELRGRLIEKVAKDGFETVIDKAAYTWFNRFIALRYMEVHGYLDHGLRVLSHPSGGDVPEILEQAQHVSIKGISKQRVMTLLSDPTKREELYQYLLSEQCRALHEALPVLFDYLEPPIRLLIPDNLLGPNSIVRKLVKEIPEDDWRTTEILGWLYQFYVSDEKARVDAYVKKGQAVEPEDIPAKTQLFTPNWIVQFLTQNSLGRLWMDVYPDSSLGNPDSPNYMRYFTPPAEQEPEVAAKLREITPDSLDPNTLTAIDPAAGSGHILLELYNLFFAMYQEQGYMPQDIPRRILEQNLYGLELDRRAAQIAGFAVLMRARADDPRLLENPPKINVLAIRSSKDLDLATLLTPRQAEEMFPSDRLIEDDQPRLVAGGRALFTDATMLRAMKELFADAEVVGSLQRIPEGVAAKLDAFAAEVERVRLDANLMENEQLGLLGDLIHQAQILAKRYTACVANPPYLGGKAMVKDLKDFAKEEYPDTKADLFAMFIERGFDYAEPRGYNAMVTMQSWMFLSSYEGFRLDLVENRTIQSMAHLGARGFRELAGEVVQTTATVFCNLRLPKFKGVFHRVIEGDEDAKSAAIRNQDARHDAAAQDEFKKIPGWPIAYWLPSGAINAFHDLPSLGSISPTKIGMRTGNNGRFLRLWWEVSIGDVRWGSVSAAEAQASCAKWFPYNKGGEFRKWYGNQEFVVNWHSNGDEIKRETRLKYPNLGDNLGWKISNEEFYFKPSLTWTFISSGGFGIRYSPRGFLFDVAGSSTFPPSDKTYQVLGYLCSTTAVFLLRALNPTLNFQIENVASLPFPPFSSAISARIESLAESAIAISRDDWDGLETSMHYSASLLVKPPQRSIEKSWLSYRNLAAVSVQNLAAIEEEISELVASSLGLAGEVPLGSSLEQITLWANPRHVFRPKRASHAISEENDSEAQESAVNEATEDEEALEAKFREKGLKELVSYALGCMMGRYSLDEPGLIYAHAGGEGFDPSRYRTFPADEDGILPLTDQPFYGEQDTAERFANWVKAVWPNSPLEENLAFIADNLGRKPEETPLEAIRRYLVEDFYGDHLQTYKKRPIYWLFSSGKKRAFQALVYLHRYHPGTLGRMRSHYVQPLIGKLQAQLQQAQAAESSAPSASEKAKRSREAKKLREQYDELLAFDEKLHHYALQAIALDLDDGVKVNYGKFSDPKIGDILAKVKDITGGKDD